MPHFVFPASQLSFPQWTLQFRCICIINYYVTCLVFITPCPAHVLLDVLLFSTISSKKNLIFLRNVWKCSNPRKLRAAKIWTYTVLSTPPLYHTYRRRRCTYVTDCTLLASGVSRGWKLHKEAKPCPRKWIRGVYLQGFRWAIYKVRNRTRS